MASAMDPASLKQHEARLVRGFLPGRFGTLYSSHLLRWANGATTLNHAMGFFWYRDNRKPHVTETSQGIRSRSRIVTLDPYWVTVWAVRWRGAHDYPEMRAIQRYQLPPPTPYQEFDIAGIPNWEDYVHVYSVQYRDEVFFCFGPASRVHRLYADDDGVFHLYTCGIVAPLADEFVAGPDPQWFRITDDGEPGLAWESDYTYRMCWADDRYRLSSPGPDETLDMGPNPQRTPGVGRAEIIITWPDDPQVKYAVVYRAASGTTNFYACVPDGEDTVWIARPATSTTTKVYERTTEANLVVGDLCPLPGQNDPPALASAMAIYKNRLWLNDRSYGKIENNAAVYEDEESIVRVQISNLNSPTQFNSVAEPDDDALGASLVMGTDAGDRVVALGGIGSVMGVWNQRRFRYVTGNGPSDWDVEEGADVGCIGQQSLAYVQGRPYWLTEDGVYTFDAGFQPVNVALRVNNYFGGAQKGQTGSIEVTG